MPPSLFSWADPVDLPSLREQYRQIKWQNATDLSRAGDINFISFAHRVPYAAVRHFRVRTETVSGLGIRGL
jgi:hypothetical protein